MDVLIAERLLKRVELASEAMRGTSAAEATQELEASLDEISSALTWFADAGRTDDGLRLAIALYRTRPGSMGSAGSIERT